MKEWKMFPRARRPIHPGLVLPAFLFLFALLGAQPDQAAAQTAFSVSAWGGGGVFDGVAVGLAHRSAPPALLSGVTFGVGGGHKSHRWRHHGPKHHSGYVDCLDWWDWWYDYGPVCATTSWWSPWGPWYWTSPLWVPAYAPPLHPVRYAHRFRPGWRISLHLSTSWGWYDPWWGYPTVVTGWPPWHGYVHRPVYVVHSPVVHVVDRPTSVRPVSPATGYKENPAAGSASRRAVRTSTSAGPATPAKRTTAPPPDIRTRSSLGTDARTPGAEPSTAGRGQLPVGRSARGGEPGGTAIIPPTTGATARGSDREDPVPTVIRGRPLERAGAADGRPATSGARSATAGDRSGITRTRSTGERPRVLEIRPRGTDDRPVTRRDRPGVGFSRPGAARSSGAAQQRIRSQPDRSRSAVDVRTRGGTITRPGAASRGGAAVERSRPTTSRAATSRANGGRSGAISRGSSTTRGSSGGSAARATTSRGATGASVKSGGSSRSGASAGASRGATSRGATASRGGRRGN